MTRGIGLLGGTFDPPHLGHLVAAQEAWCDLGLEKVLFLPAGVPPHKLGEPVSPPHQRLRMAQLAVEGDPRFEVSTADLERPGPSYTVDLLAMMREQMGPGVALFFIVGMDSLLEIGRWHDPGGIFRRCQVVAVRRPCYPEPDLEDLARRIPESRGRIILLSGPGVEVSSTELRERVARGLPIRYLVPDRVREYIEAQGLYRGDSGK